MEILHQQKWSSGAGYGEDFFVNCNFSIARNYFRKTSTTTKVKMDKLKRDNKFSLKTNTGYLLKSTN